MAHLPAHAHPRSAVPELTRAALDGFAEAVGADHVLVGAACDEYADPYSFLGPETVRPSAVVLPGSVVDVQAVVRVAARHGVPLWPVSRGKNLGYGGAAPRVPGSAVVDLRRMDRIVEVNDELGYVVVEPGVTFLALAGHLRDIGSALMPSVPEIGWGSVLGNTLERGIGYTAHGDHSAFQCGMEVVLADGTVVRTGMGAKTGSEAFALFKGGYGPSIDGLFFQSNLGIVTRLGIWLMPRPESIAVCMVTAPEEDALAGLVEAIRPLLLDGTVQSTVVVANAVTIASMVSVRSDWYDGDGPMPDQVIDAITDRLHIGRWNAKFALYGPAPLVEARLEVIRAAIPEAELTVTTYAGDVNPADVHPADQVQLGIPSTDLIRMAAWSGGAPAHTDFSLVCPPTGHDAVRQMRIIRDRVEARGFDYSGVFIMNPRHAISLAPIPFDGNDPDRCRQVAGLVPELIAAASAAGYASYRSHTAFMDLVADQYDANDSALRRTVERIKEALDPQGILAAGKQGIWPRTS
ncbi:FAD-binding oxidoreductase [Nonomuraea monospora]|uniref:FAD-binding oxidoreductase n=1 Tax=Nonomuraea monospora TaxID=568818 RepID=A0ABP5PX95_9ACTN